MALCGSRPSGELLNVTSAASRPHTAPSTSTQPNMPQGAVHAAGPECLSAAAEPAILLDTSASMQQQACSSETPQKPQTSPWDLSMQQHPRRGVPAPEPETPCRWPSNLRDGSKHSARHASAAGPENRSCRSCQAQAAFHGQRRDVNPWQVGCNRAGKTSQPQSSGIGRQDCGRDARSHIWHRQRL